MAKREMKKREENVANVDTEIVETEAPVVEEAKNDVIGTVSATGYDKLNIRKAPKTNAEVVTTVVNGTKLTIVDIEKANGDWYKVEYKTATGAFNGYCMKKFINLD